MKVQRSRISQCEYSQIAKNNAESKTVARDNFITRELISADAYGLFELEQEVWKDEAASIPMLEKRIKNTKGFCWAAYDDFNNAKASAFMMGISKSKLELAKDWYETTDSGTAQFHDPASKVVFGISLAGINSEAVDDVLTRFSVKVLLNGIKEVYLGSPLSGLVEYKNKHPDVDVNEYVFKKTVIEGKKRYRDSHLNYYSQLGFKPVAIKENYFPYPGSDGYAAIICAKNPFFPLAPLFRWIGEERINKNFKIIRKIADWVM